jgi:hypothetical protein
VSPGRLDFIRHWQDSRRFRRLTPAQRRIVFYSEDAAGSVHLEPIARYLGEAMGREVAYLSSSERDPVLKRPPKGVIPFWIGEGMVRTSLFIGLDAGVMVMTMPDLETYHIKRSRAHPVHYAYVFHSIVSTHMIYRPHAFDHYDTILCVGPHHVAEIRATEKRYGLKAEGTCRARLWAAGRVAERAAPPGVQSGFVKAGRITGADCALVG